MRDQLRDTVRKASRVVEAPRRRTEEAVRKMAENPNFDLFDAPHLAWEMLRRGRSQAEKARAALDEQIRRRLHDMGLATKEELDRLQRRVSELEAAAAATHAGGASSPKASGSSEARPARKPRASRSTASPRTSRPSPTRSAAPSGEEPSE
jgi:polyhydroxyalkanoate synthesis regulator phasin